MTAPVAGKAASDEMGHNDRRRANNAAAMLDSPTPTPTEEDGEEGEKDDAEEEDEEEGDEGDGEGEEEEERRTGTTTTTAASPVARLRRARMHRRNREAPRNKQGQLYCDHTDCASSKLTFGRRCEWDKHMDKHERPYRCEEKGCEKLRGFTYSGGLLRHEREVHGKHGGLKRPLMCPYDFCKRSTGLGFTRQENLNEHLRRVHRVVRCASTPANGGALADGASGSTAGTDQTWAALNGQSTHAIAAAATATRAGSSGSSGVAAARATASKDAAARLSADPGRGGGAGASAALGAGAGQKRKVLQMEAEALSGASSTESGLEHADCDNGLGSVDRSGGRPELTVAELRSELMRLHQRIEYMEKKARAQDTKRKCLDKRLGYLEEKVRVLNKWLTRVLLKQFYSALMARQEEASNGEQHEQELEFDDEDIDE